MNTADFDYTLPDALIAQEPAAQRTASRMLVVHRDTESLEHRSIADVGEYLEAGDLLVVNNTKVIPARLLGKKSTGGRVEVLIIGYAAGLTSLENTGSFQCQCLVRDGYQPAGSRASRGRGQGLRGSAQAAVFQHAEKI